jgi:hypothetical protein
MRRSRLIAVVAATAAMIIGSLVVASPARADSFGPFQNFGNGLCIQPEGNSTDTGAAIVQEPCDRDPVTGEVNPFQSWRVSCLNSSCSVFHFVNVASGLCMRARGLTGPANGEEIMLWFCNRITDVNWHEHDITIPNRADILPEYLESRLSGSTGFCLDVPGGSAMPGQALQLFQCNGTAAQIWYVSIFVG